MDSVQEYIHVCMCMCIYIYIYPSAVINTAIWYTRNEEVSIIRPKTRPIVQLFVSETVTVVLVDARQVLIICITKSKVENYPCSVL
jgi:hypothetical protein